MVPLIHRRRTRRVIAQWAIAATLGVLLFTPKLDAGQTGPAAPVDAATVSRATAG